MRLLLLNGVYGAPEHFDSLRDSLAPEIETRVFPLRREGLPDPSTGTGFAPLVDRLDREIASFTSPGDARPAVLGFSLGGALALEYALTHPGRVPALVLINSFARYEHGPLQAATTPMLHG
ncbi:MAG TPA: alpha/beta hydrolase, partial [Candidatus Eisenbacteria bacterium]